MTARKPLPTICRCICGKAPVMYPNGIYKKTGWHWVQCDCGWSGPVRKTARAAILAWNRVMPRNYTWDKFNTKSICDRIRKSEACEYPGILRGDLFDLLKRIEEGK